MHIFRKGKWISVEVPLSDPILTEGHKRRAAAVIAAEMLKGSSQQDAVLLAERKLYEELYPGLQLGGGSGRVPRK